MTARDLNKARRWSAAYHEAHKDDAYYKERRRTARHRWYARHKDDPDYKEMRRIANHATYYRNTRRAAAKRRKDDFYDTHPSVLYPNFGD
jgi:hypothetical protein